jgi:Tol biopolymer transport system component
MAITSSFRVMRTTPRITTLRWDRCGTGSSRDLFQGVTNAIYVEPGELLFVRSGALLAQAFDAKTLALGGEPRVIAEKVVESDENHCYEFTASSNGRLLYRSGRTESQLTWVDRFGRVAGTVGDAHRLGTSFRLSPDQQRVIVDETDADGRADDIWVFNVSRPLATRFTFDPAGEFGGLWSADGSKVVFTSMRTGMGDLYEADAGTPTNVKRLTSVSDQLGPTSWTRDGAWILADRYLKADMDIWMFPLAGGEARPYISTPFSEGSAELSPDNSLVAYTSDESGHNEVYVEHFPTHAGRRQVSAAGGGTPRWRSDGKELFYIAARRQLDECGHDQRDSHTSCLVSSSGRHVRRHSRWSAVPRRQAARRQLSLAADVRL